MAKRGDFTATGAFYWDDALSLAAYAGTDVGSTPYQVLLTDAAGKTARGFIGAVGSGTAGTGTLVEKLTDGGLENWTTDTNLTSWTEAIVGTSTVNKESVDKHGGTYAARLDIDASNSNAHIVQSITLVPLALIKLSVWHKASVAGKIERTIITNNTGLKYLASTGLWDSGSPITFPTTTTWANYSQYFNAYSLSTGYNVYLARSSSISSSVYFDDYSIVQITDPPPQGIHILSAYNGTTRGWTSVDSGFEPATITSAVVSLASAGGGGLGLTLSLKL